MIVGNLGDLEVVFFCLDDGDVGAYYTHTIARYITAKQEHRHQARGSSPSHLTPPVQFFLDNVSSSAWGLAVHEKSRLLAVSSNLHEVTVFAFALNHGPHNPGPSCDGAVQDTSPKLPSNVSALQLERHFASRTRTWKIILPLGVNGHNVPTISFCDDEDGNAEKVVALDIYGSTWILDIWRVGSFPVVYSQGAMRDLIHHRYGTRPPCLSAMSRLTCVYRTRGWGVLVLPDSSFMETKTVRECLGLPAGEVIVMPPRLHVDAGPTHHSLYPSLQPWLDTTCSLFYVKELAANPHSFLRPRVELQNDDLYADVHNSSLQNPDDEQPDDELAPLEIDVSSAHVHGDSDHEFSTSDDFSEETSKPRRKNARWSALDLTVEKRDPPLDDLDQDVQFCRTIVPSLGQMFHGEDADHAPDKRWDDHVNRKSKTRPTLFARARFPRHMSKNLCILRSTGTDIELQPFDRRGTAVTCKSVLVHHNHHGMRLEPYDLTKSCSERISMLIHVPELHLVVAGSLNGRVALLTLTKTVALVKDKPIRRGFRIDKVLPRKSEEDMKLRPWCCLHGMAMSRVPDRGARGLDLQRGDEPRALPLQFRLILHYMNHNILSYVISRREADGELLVF